MNGIIQKLLDRCNEATPSTEPDWIVIHSLNHIQTAVYDAWAVEQAELLKRHGWRARRLGTALHLVPSALVEEAA